MLVRRGLQASNLLVEPDGRLISIDVNDVTYIGLYAPSGSNKKKDRSEFFKTTVPAYFLAGKNPAILMGDFNAVEDSSDRGRNSFQATYTSHDQLTLREMIKVLELKDAWRTLKPLESGFTRINSISSSRIDRIYVSGIVRLENIALSAITFGDHLPLMASITTRTPVTNEAPKAYGWAPLDSSRMGSSARLDWARYQELRRELKAWEDESLRGYYIRSRVQDGGPEETASLHHVKRSKKNENQSKITMLQSQSGVSITQESEINVEIIDHFTKLFKNQRPPDNRLSKPFIEGVTDAFIKRRASEMPAQSSASFTKIDDKRSRPAAGEPARTLLDAPITNADIKLALLDTKPNKSPGTDGIPYEFYIKFWDNIGPHFLAMFNFVLESGSVLPSQGKAAVRLIPKVPAPKTLSNYRPISLLNSDYKIMASVLAKRLRPTLPHTLGEHQKGGVPGRFIFDSLCLYRDAIEETARKSNIEIKRDKHLIEYGAAIISFDLEKAYDLVNRDVLWGILGVMGYPPTFIGWLKALYAITTISPLNGNEIVGNIHEAQSLRQGCPLSMHLFAIYIEPLLARLSSTLDGIELNGKRVAVRGFVDDLVVFASSDYDIATACSIVDDFCGWTKARVNKPKSHLLGLGAWDLYTQSEKQAAGLPGKTWPVQCLKPVRSSKLLGVEFTSRIKSTIAKSWESMCNKMVGALRSNVHRKFTLYGRVLFIK